MNKSLILLVAALAIVAWAEPPQDQLVHHHYHGVKNHRDTKVRQSGSSKIFGWLGSRFAKIPSYLPRFPQFPKHSHSSHSSQKLPTYQAVVLPDPPTGSGHNKVKSPELVKISKVKNEQPEHHEHVTSYQQSQQQHQELTSSAQNIGSYAPVPASVYNSYSVPETAPQIEVLQSTLLYHNNQVYPNGNQVAQATVANPAVASYPQYQQYASPIAAPPLQYSHASVNNIPAPASKPSGYVQSFKNAGPVPVVPQSTGPDYFDTAYRSPHDQGKQAYQAHQHHQSGGSHYQGSQSNYGATFDYQQVPQVYDTSIDLAAMGGPVMSSSDKQVYSQSEYNQQSLTNEALSKLIASIPDSAANKNENSYASYAQAASSYMSQKAGPSSSSSVIKTDIPGVQILSQSTDGGNPVFEVLADANAPNYNGHPFDINKLISMIEPGAELESAELSPASSETKSTYASAAGATTSGIKDLLLSESERSSSVSKLDGSKFTRPPFPLNFNVNPKNTNNASASLKEIVDFFQQTGGKGYVVVEKKRHRPDNLTLDFDQTPDDDLTNGPTRVNITSDMIFPHLNQNTSVDDLFTPEQDYYDDDIFGDDDRLDDTDNTNNLVIISSDSSKAKKTENSTTPENPSDTLDSSNITRSSSTTITTTPTTTTPTTTTPTTSTSTLKSVDWATPTSQLTTLFEPVTPGKPAIFAVTPSPLPGGVTLNPNHNYEANPSFTYTSTTSQYSDSGERPTFNPFLDAVEESVLDEPTETEGDLIVAESQQVRSIAITVTPPPKLTNTTPRSAKSLMKDAAANGNAGTATTTTEKPSSTTVLSAIDAPVTKKTSSNATSSKGRPSPVYRGKKSA